MHSIAASCFVKLVKLLQTTLSVGTMEEQNFQPVPEGTLHISYPIPDRDVTSDSDLSLKPGDWPLFLITLLDSGHPYRLRH